MRTFLLLLLCLMTIPAARAGDDCPGCADLYGIWWAGSRNEYGKELVILEDRHLFQINGDIIRENRMKLIQHNGGTADFSEKNHRFIFELIDPYEQGRKTFKYWTVFDENDRMSLWSYYCETEEAARAYYRNFDFENRKLEEGCIHGLYANGPSSYTVPEKIDKYYIPTPEEICPASIYGVWRKLGKRKTENAVHIYFQKDKEVSNYGNGAFSIYGHKFLETRNNGRIVAFKTLSEMSGLGKEMPRKKSSGNGRMTIKKNYRYILGVPQCDIKIEYCHKNHFEEHGSCNSLDPFYYRWSFLYDQPFFKKKPKPAPVSIK